uniref:Uncharacterized protein n=1 Tax=Setaria digitata TaxID=48799 RepID=A0A915PZ07_9BILA
MFLNINWYQRSSAHGTLITTPLMATLLFSLVLLPIESSHLFDLNRHFSDYEQLISDVESEKQRLQQRTKVTRASSSDSSVEGDEKLQKINLTLVRYKAHRAESGKEFIDQAYINGSQGNIRNISEKQFREILERILHKHLELARKKIAYANNSANSFIYQNKTSVNPTNIPAPIDYSKPYVIKCDSRGSCYASPLNDDEVPPLPSYNRALTCPTYPLSVINTSTTTQIRLTGN